MRSTEYIAWSELAGCCCYNDIIITIAKPGKRIGEKSTATTYPPCCLGVNVLDSLHFSCGGRGPA